MCMAIPMKVIEKKADTGKVETGGVYYQANFSLIPEVVVGDYVLIHAGFAIERLDEEEAKKTLDLFDEIYKKDSL